MSVLNERSGDHSIDFIPISNIINISIGLGLPWLIESIYCSTKGKYLVIKSNSYILQLIWIIVCYMLCLLILFLRRRLRFFGSGELGGSVLTKFCSAYFLTFCYFLFFFFNFINDFKL
jgi:solute carrier family 8 (sodium/calcium exchanger)